MSLSNIPADVVDGPVIPPTWQSRICGGVDFLKKPTIIDIFFMVILSLRIN